VSYANNVIIKLFSVPDILHWE